MRRRAEPLPAPPPLGGIAIDGSNVIASGAAFTLDRLDAVLAWCADWRPELPVVAFVDAGTARRLRRAAQDALRLRCQDVTPGRARHVVCPPDAPADEILLAHVRGCHGLVVSNDRYADFDELRTGVVTLQFRFAAGAFVPFVEATWFRPTGGAQRVDLAALRT
jgi:hypothetical protein